MRVWLPAIRSGTGTDVFTVRLRDALIRNGIDAEITWFPLWVEFFPGYLRWVKIPPGTDIIHANGWAGEGFVNRGTPVIITVHHLVHDPAYKPFCSKAQRVYHRWHLRHRDMKATKRANKVTAVSHYVAETVKAFSGETDISVIHNWVETEKYSPTQTPSSSEKFKLLLAGNQSRRKGFDYLPTIIDQLGENFEIRCTGGLRQDQLRRLPNVQWLGKLSESSLINEYQHCDAVLSLSRYEGFGYTALEGMACGKPVVGFATSGLNEVATEECAKLVSVGDTQALIKVIQHLRDDPVLCRELGNAGRARAEKLFSEQPSVRKLLDLYRQTLNDSQPGQ